MTPDSNNQKKKSATSNKTGMYIISKCVEYFHFLPPICLIGFQ